MQDTGAPEGVQCAWGASLRPVVDRMVDWGMWVGGEGANELRVWLAC